MQLRHYSQGKFYLIGCPEGSRVSPSRDGVVVPVQDQMVMIPTEPPELLPLLAEAGRCGLSLFGEPRPEWRLEGVSCASCGEDDATWLRLEEDAAVCERCEHEFAVMPSVVDAGG